MSDTDSWEELAWQFEDLDPDASLALIWSYDRAKKDYTFGYAWSQASAFARAADPHKNSESYKQLVTAKFTAYSTRAGRKMAIHGDPFYWWLVEVKLRGQNDAPGEGVQFDPMTDSDKAVIQGRINDVCKIAAALCYSLEANPRPYVRILQAESIPPLKPITVPKERKELRDAYLVRFPNTLILDICWAAAQHYSEWKRWLRGPLVLKDGSAPDTAFRQLLTSGKSPPEYRKQSRPKGWN